MSAQRASQLVEAGLWLRLSGDHEGARRLFEQALKLDPANARARQLLESPPPQPAPLGGVTKTTMDVDWGMAAGRRSMPPPVEPVAPELPKTDTRPFGQGPPAPGQTVKLGEAAAPEIPDAPRFDDPADEIQITGADDEPPPDTSTLVFGMSGVPPPPAAPLEEPRGTLVFGSGAPSPLTPPPIPPVAGPASGTMLFGSSASSPLTPPPIPPVAGPGSGTLVFGSKAPSPPPPGATALDKGTLLFGSEGLDDLGEPPGRPAQEEPIAPGEEAPRQSLSPGTLEFNFDDMVTQAPPAPAPSPSVPHDDDDAPKTAWDRSNPRIDIAQIQEGEGGGFDLISAPTPQPKTRSPEQLRAEVATLLSGAKDLLDLDDHSGAMELINKALELDPTDASVLKLKERSEKTLQAMFESKLGDLDKMPRVKLKDDEIIWLNLDHRAGFVLAQIDGAVSFEDLFAVSGMSRLDTARILAQLVEEGVITKD